VCSNTLLFLLKIAYGYKRKKRRWGHMHTQKFLHRVQERAGLGDHDAALRAVAATLATLAEPLPRAKRAELAAQLPQELKTYLSARPETAPFSLEEFYNRVRARADVGYPDAINQARAVVAVLREATSTGTLEHIFRTVRDQYGELLGDTPQGPVSPSLPEPVL
jgi:uncharacterized protein (DUF2267 family)